MTARENFRKVMSERRQWMRGTPDHEYRTRAARKYVWMMRGIAPNQWGKL